MLLRVGLGI